MDAARAGRTDGRFVRARNRTRDVGDRPGALFAGGTHATGLGDSTRDAPPRCYDPRRRRSTPTPSSVTSSVTVITNGPRVEPRSQTRRRTRERRTRRRRLSWRDKKSREPRLQRDADALVRQERRVAEKQRRADGVARRKEWNAKAESADREAVRVRVQMRLDAARKKKKPSTRNTRRRSPCAARSGRNGARWRRYNAPGSGGGRGVRARPSRERDTSKFARTSEKLDRRLRLESARVAAELARDEEAFLAKIASRAERIGVEADGVMARAFDVEARAEEEAFRWRRRRLVG